MAYWTSKLGNKYLKASIDQDEKASKANLDQLRKIPTNRRCADCGMEPTVWASVNLGIFLCIRCGSLHRGIGTHISVPKGCTGTYLWGPDELESMAKLGNAAAEAMYGGTHARPQNNASDAIWRQFIIDKYERRVFAPKGQVHAQKTDNKINDDKSAFSSHFRIPTNAGSSSKISKTKNKLTMHYGAVPMQIIDPRVPVDDLLNLNGYDTDTVEGTSDNNPKWEESRFAKEKDANANAMSGESLIDTSHGNGLERDFVSEQDFFAQFGL